ncbi:MAG: hypothetical protein ACE5FJ_08230 [Gemmatimonadales bacterium]
MRDSQLLSIISIVVGTLGPIIMGVVGYFIKRTLKRYDRDIETVKQEVSKARDEANERHTKLLETLPQNFMPRPEIAVSLDGLRSQLESVETGQSAINKKLDQLLLQLSKR